jgi:hypothetical protein
LDFGRTGYYVKTGGFSDIELASIADLHVREISEGFLSSLGARPLRLLYRHAADSAHCVLIGVFAGQGRSVGFICGTSESVALRREFLRVKWNAQGGLDLYPTQDSAVLTSTAWADGLVDNPAGGAVRRGDSVRFLSYSELYR